MIAWLLAVALAATTPHADADGWSGWLAAHHAALVERAVWQSPTDRARRALARAVQALAGRRDTCTELDTATAAAAEAGFSLSIHAVEGLGAFAVLEEPAHGGGLYVVRCGVLPPEQELVVQAPHALHDVATDELARHALVGGAARVLMLNTVHRYRALPDERPADPVHPADVTRQPTSAFHTVALAWSAAVPVARTVQLHGYGEGHTAALVVLSSGDETRPPRALEAPVAAALGVDVAAVEVFGSDGRTLGGTQNVLARALLAAPVARFVHVELARDVRERLSTDAAAATAFLRALGSAPWTF